MFKEKPMQAHIAEIDLSVLYVEAPSDKDESSYFNLVQVCLVPARECFNDVHL